MTKSFFFGLQVKADTELCLIQHCYSWFATKKEHPAGSKLLGARHINSLLRKTIQVPELSTTYVNSKYFLSERKRICTFGRISFFPVKWYIFMEAYHYLIYKFNKIDQINFSSCEHILLPPQMFLTKLEKQVNDCI